MAQENIDVTVRLRNELTRRAEQAERSLAQLQGEVQQLNTSLAAAQAAQQRTERALEALRRTANRTDRSMNQLNDRLRANRNGAALAAAAFGGLGDRMGKASKSSAGLGAAMKALKLPAILTAASLAAGGIAAIGAAGVAAVAGLAPLVGLGGGVLALGAAAMQAKGVFTLAMQGIGDAVKVLSDPSATAAELSAALKELSPQAQTFAIQVAKAKESSEGLKKAAQGGLLPGLGSALKSVMPLMPIVEKNIAATAGWMGKAAGDAGKLAGTMGNDLNAVMQRNTGIVRILGPVLSNVLNIFRNLLVTAGPLATRFAKAIAAGAAQLDKWVQAGRDSGKLEAFFKRAGDLGAAVAKVIRDVAIGLFNVGKESDALSGMMGKGIADAAAKFREFTESASGQAKIRQFFRDAIPLVRETALLIRDVAKAFGGLANNQDLAPIIKAIRTDLLPAVSRLAEGVTTGLGPAFVDLATAYAEFMNVLSFSPLITAVGIIGDFARAVTGFIQLTPGMSTFLATIMTLALVGKVMLSLGKITGITTILTSTFTRTLFGSTAALTANGAATTRSAAAALALRNMITTTIPGLLRSTAAWIASTARVVAHTVATKLSAAAHRVALLPALLRTTAATVASTAATVAASIASKVIRGAIIAWTAAQALLNRVLRMNPIGLVITVLTLLVGALVVAYNKSETFRRIVNRAWEMIKTGVNAVWTFLRDYVFKPLGVFFTVTLPAAARAFVAAVTSRWNAFKSMLGAGWTWVRENVFRPIGNFITQTIPGFFRSGVEFVRQRWENFKNNLSTVWTFIRTRVFEPIGRFITKTIPDAFRSGVDFIRETWDKLLEVLKKPIRIAFTFVNDNVIGPVNKMLGAFPGDLSIPTLPRLAEGGPLRGPGTGTSDSILGVNRRGVPTALVSNGEHVWTQREVDAAGGHRNVERLRAVVRSQGLPALAHGGPVDQHDDRSLLDRIGSGISNAWSTATDFLGDMAMKGARWAAEKVLTPLQSAYRRLLPADQLPLNMVRGGLDKVFEAVLGRSDAQDKAQAASYAGPAGAGTPNGVGGLGPAAAAAHNFVRQNWGFQGTIGGYAYRTIAGTNVLSKHALGKAIDVMTYSNMGLGQSIADYFAGPGRRRWGVDNVIWNRRIHSGGGWGPYFGVSPHTDHPHIDFFDQGGLARGRGLMPKNAVQPERILSPAQTLAFERLVAVLDRDEPMVMARAGAAPARGGGGGGDGGLPPMHFHFHGGGNPAAPTPEMRAWVLDTVRQADRERRERR